MTNANTGIMVKTKRLLTRGYRNLAILEIWILRDLDTLILGDFSCLSPSHSATRVAGIQFPSSCRRGLFLWRCSFMTSDSSSDEDIIIQYYYYNRYRKRKVRKMWLHPYIEKNINCRLFVAAKELQESDSKFLAFYRMRKETYQKLMQLIAPAIHYTNTNMRECVSPEERVLITLRYLATGCTFTSLALYFARGQSTVIYIVREITQLIWQVLNHTYMPIPNEEQWKTIAQRFYTLWNLPNCLGAVDGKHIRIEKLPGTGSTNFNYKQYHSIVLMACSDADGFFTTIETGYAGRNSDGGIFRASVTKQWITGGLSHLPSPSRLPDDENECDFPYYFVGDEAFPLARYLMRPYPQRTLDNTKRIFNYRLSRGRKCVECAFGMMTKKFQVLSSSISRTTKRVVDIIKSVCILHNFIRSCEGIQYHTDEPQQNFDTSTTLVHTRRDITLHSRSTAYEVRNYLANYFLTPRASLPWQWKYCTV